MTGSNVNLATVMDTQANATSTRLSMTCTCQWIFRVTTKVAECVRSASITPLGSTVTAVLKASSDFQVYSPITPNPVYHASAQILATQETVPPTMGGVSARRRSGGRKTVLPVLRGFMTIRTVSRAPAFLMELCLMRMVFLSVQVEGKTYSARARKILEERFVTSVPRDFSIFQSVHLVSVIHQHPKMKFVTQKTDNADAKLSMGSELAKNVTMDSISTRIVSLVTAMQKVLLKKFATKMKANVSAKKAMVGNDVIDARMDGLDIQTVSLVNAQVKDPRPRRVSVTRTVDSVRVK